MRSEHEPLNGDIFRTKLGWITILGRGEVLAGLQFGAATKEEARRRVTAEFGEDIAFTKWNEPLATRLTEFAAGDGGADDFRDVKIDMTSLPQFTRRVLQACRKIAPGETATYQQLATQVGSPGAARAVGGVMAKNRIPIVIPCHRVLGTGGKLTGFSAPGGCDTKRRMLDLEAGSLAPTC